MNKDAKERKEKPKNGLSDSNKLQESLKIEGLKKEEPNDPHNFKELQKVLGILNKEKSGNSAPDVHFLALKKDSNPVISSDSNAAAPLFNRIVRPAMPQAQTAEKVSISKPENEESNKKNQAEIKQEENEKFMVEKAEGFEENERDSVFFRVGKEIREIEDLSKLRSHKEKCILVLDAVKTCPFPMIGLVTFLTKDEKALLDLKNIKKILLRVDRDDVHAKKLMKGVLKLKSKAHWVRLGVTTGIKKHWMSEEGRNDEYGFLKQALSRFETEKEEKFLAEYPASCQNFLKTLENKSDNSFEEVRLGHGKEVFRKEELQRLGKVIEKNKKSLRAFSLSLRFAF